jgi:hypothetical protein
MSVSGARVVARFRDLGIFDMLPDTHGEGGMRWTGHKARRTKYLVPVCTLLWSGQFYGTYFAFALTLVEGAAWVG